MRSTCVYLNLRFYFNKFFDITSPRIFLKPEVINPSFQHYLFKRKLHFAQDLFRLMFRYSSRDTLTVHVYIYTYVYTVYEPKSGLGRRVHPQYCRSDNLSRVLTRRRSLEDCLRKRKTRKYSNGHFILCVFVSLPPTATTVRH